MRSALKELLGGPASLAGELAAAPAPMALRDPGAGAGRDLVETGSCTDRRKPGCRRRPLGPTAPTSMRRSSGREPRARPAGRFARPAATPDGRESGAEAGPARVRHQPCESLAQEPGLPRDGQGTRSDRACESIADAHRRVLGRGRLRLAGHQGVSVRRPERSTALKARWRSASVTPSVAATILAFRGALLSNTSLSSRLGRDPKGEATGDRGRPARAGACALAAGGEPARLSRSVGCRPRHPRRRHSNPRQTSVDRSALATAVSRVSLLLDQGRADQAWRALSAVRDEFDAVAAAPPPPARRSTAAVRSADAPVQHLTLTSTCGCA